MLKVKQKSTPKMTHNNMCSCIHQCNSTIVGELNKDELSYS